MYILGVFANSFGEYLIYIYACVSWLFRARLISCLLTRAWARFAVSLLCGCLNFPAGLHCVSVPYRKA